MRVTWMADAEDPRLPASWAEHDGALYCLRCQRDRAGEASLEGLPDEVSPAEREKLRSHARIEFEVQRDPDRPDNQVAKACHTSVVAVRKARERLGLGESEPPS